MAQRVGAEAREPGNGTSILLASTMRYLISTGIRASIRWLCMMSLQLAIRQLFPMNQYFFCLTLLPCIVHRLCRLQKPVMKVLTRKKTREICADLHRHGMIIGHHIYLYLLETAFSAGMNESRIGLTCLKQSSACEISPLDSSLNPAHPSDHVFPRSSSIITISPQLNLPHLLSSPSFSHFQKLPFCISQATSKEKNKHFTLPLSPKHAI